MEERGYLQAVWEAEGGRGRKVYQITSRGDEFLTAGARAAEEFLKRNQNEAEIGPFQAKHFYAEEDTVSVYSRKFRAFLRKNQTARGLFLVGLVILCAIAV